MWTGGVPNGGDVCITVAGTYSVTLPPGETFAGQLVVGDGADAGQETLVLPGCAPIGDRNRLFVNSLDVTAGGVLDMQEGRNLAQLSAAGTYSDGSVADVTGSVAWSSSNPAVATVSADGLVTGVTPGTTTIAAALGGQTASAAISVAVRPMAYVLSPSGSLSVVDGATDAAVTTVAVGGLPGSVAVSPDGSRVYVTTALGRLDAIEAATNTVSSAISVGGVPDAVAVSPDGSKVYAASASGQLAVVNAAAGTVIAKITIGRRGA